MRSTKLTAITLAVLLAMTAVSCGSNDSIRTDSATDNSDTSDSETTSGKLTDSVPALDFKEAEFRTIEQISNANPIGLEESDGDVVNDAVYESQRRTEERFNVKILPTTLVDYNEISLTINKMVMSGSNDYDLIFGQMFKSGSDAQNGIFMDWNTLPYVEFSNPWYIKSIKEATVGDKLYMLESEMSMTYHKQTWLIVYNKTKAKEIPDFPNLYKTVDSGEWTIDYLNKLTADLYRDLNGDSQKDDEDFYGILGSNDGCMLASFVSGCEGKLVELNNDLEVVTQINSEKTLDILTKLSKLFMSNEGALQRKETSRAYRMKKFVNGNVLFEAMQVNDLVNPEFGMREIKDEYGVLPLPKYSNTQEEYYTMVDGGASVMLIPTTAQNTEMIGAIVEAMSCDYYYNVTPVYTGIAIEQKGTRDDESIRMIRQILDSRIINFAYLYDGFSGWVLKLGNIIRDENTIVSTIASNMDSVTAYYESTINYLTAAE